MPSRFALLVLPLLLAPIGAQTFVRTHDRVVVQRGPAAGGRTALTSTTAAPCGAVDVAHDLLPITNLPGALVTTNAFFNPATINRGGRMAFYGDVVGAAQNQGIFTADAAGVRAVVLGCGQGGGSGAHGPCGTPCPIGGTFGGFFTGTISAPAIDDDGDVLFLADLANAPSPRGLFLFVAATQSIVKVAAVGDPSPLGGTITAMGLGTLNNKREVVFFAASTNTAAFTADLFHWQLGGSATRFLASGDPAPGGNTVDMLGTESFGFVDGTSVFTGPVPSINDCGQVAFRIITLGGPRGIAVRTNGVDQWYLTDAMATPNGGQYLDFQAAAINGRGQIAVFTDYMLPAGITSGWVVGEPGNWRNALSFFDPVDGGQCLGLAVSRGPMNPLTDDGDLLVWCDLNSNGNQERLVVCAADGSQNVIARQAQPTGIGGNWGLLDPWPSLSSTGRASISAGTPGGLGNSAHIAGVLCGPAVASSPCSPTGRTFTAWDFGPPGASFILCVSTAAQSQPLPPYGTLLIGPSPIATITGLTPYPGLAGPHAKAIAVPANPAFVGVALHFQSLALSAGSLQLTNRATTVLQ